MLIILTICLVIASIFLILYKKNKDSILLLGLCTSLMLEICGVMLFIAKKGGISQEVLLFLYLLKENISKDAIFFDHTKPFGVSDRPGKNTVSVFFTPDRHELFHDPAASKK